MTNCANCESAAGYVHKVTPNPRTDTYYCPRHLPRFLYPQAKAGLLNIPEPVLEPDPEPAPTSSKKSKKSTTDTPVDPTPTPEPDTVE